MTSDKFNDFFQFQDNLSVYILSLNKRNIEYCVDNFCRKIGFQVNLLISFNDRIIKFCDEELLRAN